MTPIYGLNSTLSLLHAGQIRIQPFSMVITHFRNPLIDWIQTDSMLSKPDGEYLLKLARKTIEDFTRGEKITPPVGYPVSFNIKRGVFCTLTKKGKLRGCIGVPYPVFPLIKAIQSAAVSACEDPRFPKLNEKELADVKVEISVLTEPEKIVVKDASEYPKVIKPNENGLILKYGSASGLFLPQVWEDLPDPVEFLDNLCMKAGLSPGVWRDKKAELSRFRVQVFKE